jgi:hypothetical protein
VAEYGKKIRCSSKGDSMSQETGYFCRAFVGSDVQANVTTRTLREAEAEITRMIRAGAASAHAIPHGKPDHEPVLVAQASNPTKAGELCRYLRHSSGPEFDRWQVAYQSKTKLLDDRWSVVALSSTGIQEYGAFGKAVLAIWGKAAAPTVVSPEFSAQRAQG